MDGWNRCWPESVLGPLECRTYPGFPSPFVHRSFDLEMDLFSNETSYIILQNCVKINIPSEQYDPDEPNATVFVPGIGRDQAFSRPHEAAFAGRQKEVNVSTPNAQRVKTTNNKGEKRRLRLLKLFLLAFIGWAAVEYWNQEMTLKEKSAQLESLSSKLNEVKKINEQYKWEINRLHDPEYIEQMIRKEYQMMKDGETLFIPTE